MPIFIAQKQNNVISSVWICQTCERFVRHKKIVSISFLCLSHRIQHDLFLIGQTFRLMLSFKSIHHSIINELHMCVRACVCRWHTNRRMHDQHAQLSLEYIDKDPYISWQNRTKQQNKREKQHSYFITSYMWWLENTNTQWLARLLARLFTRLLVRSFIRFYTHKHKHTHETSSILTRTRTLTNINKNIAQHHHTQLSYAI